MAADAVGLGPGDVDGVGLEELGRRGPPGGRRPAAGRRPWPRWRRWRARGTRPWPAGRARRCWVRRRSGDRRSRPPRLPSGLPGDGSPQALGWPHGRSTLRGRGPAAIQRGRVGRRRPQPGHRPRAHRRAGRGHRHHGSGRRLQPGQLDAERHLRPHARRGPGRHAHPGDRRAHGGRRPALDRRHRHLRDHRAGRA